MTAEHCRNHPGRAAVARVGDIPVCADMECMTGAIEELAVVVPRDEYGNRGPVSEADRDRLRRGGHEQS